MPNKNGLHLITPTSTAKTGTGSTATINANGSVTFSSCETLSLNGVFSADYDNYMIVARLSSSAASVGAIIRFRVAGTDNSTTSSYVYQYLVADNTSTANTNRYTDNKGSLFTLSSTLRSGGVVHVYGPYLVQPTAYRLIDAISRSNAEIGDIAGTHNQSTSYDGCTVSVGSGTFSGLLGVYGMRK